MSAQTVIEIALYSGLAPAAFAFGLYFALGWLLPSDLGKRYCLPAALALAVFLAMALRPATRSLRPEQFWEWIPYLGLLATFCCGLIYASGVTVVERSVAIALMAALVAWKVVPSWDDLAESRPWQVLAVAVGIVLVTNMLSPLASKLPKRTFPVWLICAAGAVAMLILAEVSVTFGRLAALPASALVGCCIASWIRPEAAEWRIASLPYSVLVGSYAFTGFIYPTEPLWPLLAIPLAPLGLWLCYRGPSARLSGARAFLVQAACVLTPIIVVAVLLLRRSWGDDW